MFPVPRRCDGIGRRAGLKIQSWQQGAGSTPATGTIPKALVLPGFRDFFYAFSEVGILSEIHAK